MKPVSSPNHPANGTVRWNDVACCQSTSPATIGASAETSASSPDAVAIGIASLPAHFTPHRLTPAKNRTSVHDMTVTGYVGQIPFVDRRARKDRGQAAGRHPAPPIANAGEVGQYRVVGTKGLRAGRRDPSDPLRVHEDELGPPRRGSPREQESDDQQRNCGAALARDIALSGEQRGDQEEALVAAAHGERGGGDPTKRAGMICGPSASSIPHRLHNGVTPLLLSIILCQLNVRSRGEADGRLRRAYG